MVKICKNCGCENPNQSTFCSDCGTKLEDTSQISQPKDNKNKIIIGVLIAIIAILLVGTVILAGDLFKEDVPLETTDFGGITMLTPVGSNFVETNSVPAISAYAGGFIMFENAGNYSHEAYSVTFSTVPGKNVIDDVVLDRQEGDITIYKDRNGNEGYYMTRDVDDIGVSMIGGDEKTMIKMLNSVKVTGDLTESATTETSSGSTTSQSTESGSWQSIGSYSGSGTGSESISIPAGKIKVELSAYPIKNYATNHLYVTSSSGDSGGVDWGSSSAVETRSDSFTFTSTGSETLDIEYYETVSWDIQIYKYQ